MDRDAQQPVLPPNLRRRRQCQLRRRRYLPAAPPSAEEEAPKTSATKVPITVSSVGADLCVCPSCVCPLSASLKSSLASLVDASGLSGPRRMTEEAVCSGDSSARPLSSSTTS